MTVNILDTNGFEVSGYVKDYRDYDIIRLSADRPNDLVKLTILDGGYLDLYGKLTTGGGRPVIVRASDYGNIITAGDGDDVLSGSDGQDILNGGDGNDILWGGFNEHNILNGGRGNDKIYDVTGDLEIDAGSGDDFIESEGLNYIGIVDGGDGRDVLNLRDTELGTLKILNVEVLETNGNTITGSIQQISQFSKIAVSDAVADEYKSVAFSFEETGSIDLTKQLAVTGILARGAIISGYLVGSNIATSFGHDQIFGSDWTNISSGDGDDYIEIGYGGLARGGVGNDVIYGHQGNTTAIFAGKYADASIYSASDGRSIVVSADGMDTLYGVTRANFDDGTYEFRTSSFTTNLYPFTLETNGQTVTMSVTTLESYDRIVTTREARNFSQPVSVVLSGAGTIDLSDELENSRSVSIQASDAGNTITTGVRNDTLISGAGIDVLIGGDGDDIYVVNSIKDRIVEQTWEGIDTVETKLTTYSLVGINVENLTYTDGGSLSFSGTGNAAKNIIRGGSGNDTLKGDGDRDVLYGGKGNDKLDGGIDIDRMYGGAGNDVYTVDNYLDIVSEMSASGVDEGGVDQVNSTASFALREYIENLTLIGALHINGDGNTLANKLIGNSGDNILNGWGGADTLIGGAGNDRLDGGEGNDSLDGGVGADIMRGGSGNDVYTVDNGGDTVDESGESTGVDTVKSSISFNLGLNIENLILTGSAQIFGTGNDLSNNISGNAADNFLSGGAGNDKLSGGVGNDTLYGNSGNDVLDGGIGADAMYGGVGDDVYTVDNVGDTVDESNDGVGIDTVKASVSFVMGANLEKLTLTGTSAVNGTGNDVANIITGNAAANTLVGGGGADNLSGGEGNDVLIGGAGRDILKGGSGSDTFVFGKTDVMNWDSVSDFTSAQGDLIQISAADYGLAVGAGLNADGSLSADYFEAGTNITKKHGEFFFNTASKSLIWDVDGVGGVGGIALATFALPPGTIAANFIHASDFVIVA